MDKEKAKVYYDSNGPSGNIYDILGKVGVELRKQRRQTDFNTMRDKVFEAKSYEEALTVIRGYVDLIDTAK
ncbi:MAG: hypothetical protein M0R51_16270 [Clostridia bacterium]|jgi:hypothetical protein|nr:hypothetical protein [Clostridia bacterium]